MADEKIVRLLKASLTAAYAGNQSQGGVSIREILKNYTEVFGPQPNVGEFGYKTVDELMNAHPEVFVKKYNGYCLNETNLNETEKKQIALMVSASNGRRTSRGGGSSARGRGGSSLRGSFNTNRGSRSGFSSNGSFTAGTRGSAFGSTASFTSSNPFNTNSFGPRQSNAISNGNFDNSQKYNSHQFSYQKEDSWTYNGQNGSSGQQNWGGQQNENYNRFDEREESGDQRNYDHKEWNNVGQKSQGNDRISFGRNNWNEQSGSDHTYLNDTTNDRDQNEPWSHDRYEDQIDEPRYASTPAQQSFGFAPSPALSTGSTFLPPPPGLTRPGSAGRFIPPPGLAAPIPSSIFAAPSSPVPSLPSKLSSGDAVRTVLDEMRKKWPDLIYENQLLDLLKRDSRFAHISSSIGAVRDRHLDMIVQKMAKSAFKPYYRVKETDNGRGYVFVAGHPSGENQADLAQTTRNMVATYCFEHGTETLERLADALGIEDQGGFSAVAWLGGMLEEANENGKPILEFGAERGPHMTVSTMKGATFSNYIPPRPKSLLSMPQQPVDQVNSFDMSALIRETQKKFADVVQSTSEFFEVEHEPLSTVLKGTRDYPKGSVNVQFTDAIDLQTFWVRSADDNETYVRLKEAMLASYVTQPDDFYDPVIGETVAFWQEHREKIDYLRGYVLEKTRKEVRVMAIDEGCHYNVNPFQIMPLQKYFSELPSLAVRCSIGDFEVANDHMLEFDEREHDTCSNMLGRPARRFIIRHVRRDCLIVDVQFECNGEYYDLPEDHLQTGFIRMCSPDNEE